MTTFCVSFVKPSPKRNTLASLNPTTIYLACLPPGPEMLAGMARSMSTKDVRVEAGSSVAREGELPIFFHTIASLHEACFLMIHTHINIDHDFRNYSSVNNYIIVFRLQHLSYGCFYLPLTVLVCSSVLRRIARQHPRFKDTAVQIITNGLLSICS
jgi:hypothetical protein